ncbi:MAG: hypothetical protein G01um101438_119 [Parcubacteria group bacterium Gr01-1014_38]|nr:MAG: hypothetical protein G01um101438_119 [Parcubacteria group bacterium Gr01-1014_38]
MRVRLSLVLLGIVAVAVFLLVGTRTVHRGAPEQRPVTSEQTRDLDGRTILVTDGVKHLVPLEEIISGGPPRDGIPPIEMPQFSTLPERDPVLRDDGIGLTLVINGDARFYPYQILVWHEIVNDTVGGQPVAVTYCPLCFTGIVFNRRVAGQETTFGTSGKLWQSNLVMYDRATDSSWSQVTGEAIVGERAGTQLAIIPSDTMPLRIFSERYPQGKVLTTATGQRRDYTLDPYGDFSTSREPGIGVTRPADSRFHPKEVMMGLTIERRAVAISVKHVLEAGSVTGTIDGATIVARGDREAQSVQVFRREANGSLTRLPAFPVFWFSWAASHPQTMVLPAP